MFDIGFWELLVVALVALVVVGPERLPKLIRVTGLWMGRATASIQSIRNDISRELHAEELQQAFNKTMDVSDINKILDTGLTSKPSTSVKKGMSDNDERMDTEATTESPEFVKNDVLNGDEAMNIEPTIETASLKKDDNENG